VGLGQRAERGWGGRGAQLAAFVEPLLARGFSVVTLDAPAHPPVRAVVAHSLGAVS
jgi:alpha-beta hydrolase superfamily lysophospholipase